jgi:predicted LPLAT superfamily acyltransferase
MTHLDAFRQFWSFGVSLVDKVVSWRRELPLERFTWKGLEQMKGLLAAKQGVIFMGAHVGNIEVLRAFGEGRKVIIHTLMFTGHSRQFKRFLESVNQNSFLRVHDLQSEDTALVFTLQEAIAQGEIVALLFDRIPKLSSSRSVSVPFLGDHAPFPEGPWILASVLEAPVFSAFCMQGGDGRYHVEFELLTDRVILPRNERAKAIKGYVSHSIERLTNCVKRYRYQWYNFFDFWPKNDRPI